MKIRILCMIALVLSATACSNPQDEVGTKKAGFLNSLGMDSTTAHMVKNG